MIKNWVKFKNSLLKLNLLQKLNIYFFDVNLLNNLNQLIFKQFVFTENFHQMN